LGRRKLAFAGRLLTKPTLGKTLAWKASPLGATVQIAAQLAGVLPPIALQHFFRFQTYFAGRPRQDIVLSVLVAVPIPYRHLP
jgi:hypothetical protein